MNSTGLNIIKTLGCMTAVTFFTIYNTRDHYDYDYHWILGFLTFISTIATPLFFVVAGYLDSQSRHDAQWQMGKIKRHCCKVSDEAAFCLIQRPYISKTLLTRRISPKGSP